MSRERLTEVELLDQLTETVEATTEDAAELITPLSAAQRLWRPAPERWGVADCFEHLLVTADLYHPRIRAAFQRPGATAQRPRDLAAAQQRYPGSTLVGRMLLSNVTATVRRPLKAPRIFQPSAEAQPDAPDRFLARQPELLALLREARGLDLHRARLGTPISRWLRLTLADALRIVVWHQERHLGQARRVLKAPGFPTT